MIGDEDKSGPFFQDLLEACYYRSGGEKLRPFHFDWSRIEPAKLALYQKTREWKAKSDKKHQAERVAKNRDRRAQNRTVYNAKAALRHRQRESSRQARAAWNKLHPMSTEQRNRAKESIARREASAKRKALKQSARTAEELYVITLQNLEHPTFIIESPGRKTTREMWPLNDEAARFIASAERLDTAVQIPLDTAPDQA
jgi:hypothetical protein